MLIDVFAKTGQWASHQVSQANRASYLTTKIWVLPIGATANLLTITVVGYRFFFMVFFLDLLLNFFLVLAIVL